MKTIFAYGDYGYNTECVLAEFNSVAEGKRWLNGYIRDGNMGGYKMIEIASIAENGEYVVHESVYEEED
jgi:hypothetical protein